MMEHLLSSQQAKSSPRSTPFAPGTRESLGEDEGTAYSVVSCAVEEEHSRFETMETDGRIVPQGDSKRWDWVESRPVRNESSFFNTGPRRPAPTTQAAAAREGVETTTTILNFSKKA